MTSEPRKAGKIQFTKLSAAGNDFILFEETRTRLNWAEMARKVCPRRTAIGADGIIVARRPDTFHSFRTSTLARKLPRQSGGTASLPRVKYFNSDGSRAFCANGARSAAMWMYFKGWTCPGRARPGRKGRKFSFLFDNRFVEAEIVGEESVKSRMPPARDLRLGIEATVDGKKITLHFVDTGVPHAVVPVGDLDDIPVPDLGRKLRRHKLFRPAGANVDFVKWGRSAIRIRTYERGVEEETLACGTGAVAAAVVGAYLKKLPPPLEIKTRGGDILVVSFEIPGKGLPSEIWLQGPVRISFEGEIPVPGVS